MKASMVLMVCFLVAVGMANASEPDCTPQEEVLKTAHAAAHAKPDPAKCAELKGKDKRRCEAEARNLVKKSLAIATKALACCKNPSACK